MFDEITVLWKPARYVSQLLLLAELKKFPEYSQSVERGGRCMKDLEVETFCKYYIIRRYLKADFEWCQVFTSSHTVAMYSFRWHSSHALTQ
jgi:hypothetical protein